MLPGLMRVLAMFLLASLLPLSYARAGEAKEEHEPRLILDGGHAVQAGQVVVLEWTAAQEVEELEILLAGRRTHLPALISRSSTRAIAASSGACRRVWARACGCGSGTTGPDGRSKDRRPPRWP
jgi:hypothetical protein